MRETEDQRACPDADYHGWWGCTTCGLVPLLDTDFDDLDYWRDGDEWGPYEGSR